MSENNKAIFVIVAPDNYDVKQYSLSVRNNFPKGFSMIGYDESEIAFEFNETDENGNSVAIVEYSSETPLKNPRITLFDGTIDESRNYKPKNTVGKYLPFSYPDDNMSASDNNKSQVFKIELCESHNKTLRKYLEGELCYEYWTEDQLNKYKGKLSNIVQIAPDFHESFESASDQNTGKEKGLDEENDKILLNIRTEENVNACLLNGKFYLLNNENNKIYLDKNKRYKIEPVYYDKKKRRFYYFPKTRVYKFNTSDINEKSINAIIKKSFFAVSYYSHSTFNFIACDIKKINHEKSSNVELGFGIPLALGAIGFALALFFGGLPTIIALIAIIGLGCLGIGLITKGSYYKYNIFKEPKEDKSQEPETENFDEQTPTVSALDDPIWSYNPDPNPLFNENGQPLTDDDDPFANNFEEGFF